MKLHDINFECIIGNTPLVKISDNLYAKLETYNPTGSIKVNIGNVFSIPSTDGSINPERLEYFTNMIMYQIANLLPEQKRGIYATKKR